MAKPSPIGEQVARLRVLRAWSQEELAHRAGVAVDTVRKLESGTRGMVRLHTLSMISAALDVELSVALVAPSLLPPVAAGGLLAIRTALTSADLMGLAEYAETGPVPHVGKLTASVDTAWKVWQAGQYDVLASTLPDLIAEARHAVRETTGDDQVTAYGLLATCCQIAAGVTVMVGAEDLAWTAVERSLAAAEQSGDQLSRASAAQFASWIYRRQGRYTECQQVATRAAEHYEPRMSTAEPAQLSIWGGLLVGSSGAAARANRPGDADDLLGVAAAAAARLGEDRWDRWSVFGPRLVAQTRVVNACEMGDYETACRAADRVPAGRLSPSWEGRYLLGLAQAQAECHRDAEALATLTTARTVAGEWIRYYRLARDITLELCERAGSRRSALLDRMVEHLKLVPAG